MIKDELPAQPLIILAGVQYVSDDTVEQMKRYIAKGGRILWLNDNLEFDHYGHKRNTSSLKAFSETDKVIRFGSLNEMIKYWPTLFEDTAIDCPFEIETRDGKVVDNIEILSTVDDNHRSLVFLANTHEELVSFQLRFKLSDTMKFTDLITDKEVDLKNIQISGNEVMLLGIK